MARRRRRQKHSGLITFLPILGVGILCWWWVFGPEHDPSRLDTTLTLAPKPKLTTDRPELVPSVDPKPGISEKGANSPATPESEPSASRAHRMKSLIAAGSQALTRDDLVAARAHFSEAMAMGASGQDAVLLRAELTRIGTATIFSSRTFANDPHVVRYVVSAGDTLGKIASANKVSADLLAEINGLRDKHMIRLGQAMKIIKGPFRAVVDRKTFSLDVYLGNTFVRHYKVGLGSEGSTPSGEWRISAKLMHPTYYPPRGGQIIAADDPKNPLGDRWIGLEGTAGEALGQLRYGIHGTIEPDSIGQNSSLGCIRMYNADVEALYNYLVERYSTVTVR